MGAQLRFVYTKNFIFPNVLGFFNNIKSSIVLSIKKSLT